MRPNFKALAISVSIVVSLIFAIALGAELPGPPATDFKLAPDLSFSDDSGSKFPIEGKNLSDGSVAADHATVIFFGTANCWNTAREAERLVQVYPQYKDKVRFVVVDLRSPSLAQQALIDRYYHGYIPTIAVIDSAGKVLYDRAWPTASGSATAGGIAPRLRTAPASALRTDASTRDHRGNPLSSRGRAARQSYVPPDAACRRKRVRTSASQSKPAIPRSDRRPDFPS